MIRTSVVLKLAVLVPLLTCAVGRPVDVLAVQANHPQPSTKNQSKTAGGQEIACPVQQVKAEITTKLPDPWWNTPQVGKLESVVVTVIAGQKTLACRYSAYGTQVSVMRHFPEGVSDCRVAGNHFVCR